MLGRRKTSSRCLGPGETAFISIVFGLYPNVGLVPECLKQAYNFAGSWEEASGKEDCRRMQAFRVQPSWLPMPPSRTFDNLNVCNFGRSVSQHCPGFDPLVELILAGELHHVSTKVLR